jgi:hypothetical protein
MMGPAGAVALADCPHLASLGWLDLSNNQVGDRGGLALARSPHLERLVRLDLAENPLSPAVRSALRERFGERVRL